MIVIIAEVDPNDVDPPLYVRVQFDSDEGNAGLDFSNWNLTSEIGQAIHFGTKDYAEDLLKLVQKQYPNAYRQEF